MRSAVSRGDLLGPADLDPLDIVLRRTGVLVADLRRSEGAARIEPLADALAALKDQAAGVRAF